MARVCGNLAVSRSLGDYTYKDMPKLSDIEQKVSPEADMTVIERSVRQYYHTTYLLLIMSTGQRHVYCVRLRRYL